MLLKGRTAIEGFSDGTCGAVDAPAAAGNRAGLIVTLNARIGRAMFFTVCSPKSFKTSGSLSRIWSRVQCEMQMLPGSASPSNWAAKFTPSPKMSSPLDDHVAEIDPYADSIRRSRGTFAL
jgi:hypothetical protein